MKVAAVQMDANPAPTEERLERAGRLVAQAAQGGAQLVVLPEVFNTGYGYAEENFGRAEPLDGPTVAWMKETAARHQVHLTGSLMVWEEGEIYNRLLLFAPDGRRWQYDKNYPWGWERGFYRGRKRPAIAETDLGNLGLMICWDSAHLGLWQQYAGKVDIMIISSCPPDVTNSTLLFPNGDRVGFGELGRVTAGLRETGRLLFGPMVEQQAGWLGVPMVQTVGTGRIRTEIPNSLASLLIYLPIAPRLLRYISQAGGARLESDFVPGCKVVDGREGVRAELKQEDGEGVVLAEVQPTRSRPGPTQPRTLLSRLAYLSSDVLIPLLMLPVYRRRKQWAPGRR